MAVNDRAPRIWLDVEHGASFGSAADSIDVFEMLREVLGPVHEAWLFHRDSSAQLRGFYYPRTAHQRFNVPKGHGPQLVLINLDGDQLWFGGAACGPDEKAAAAGQLLGQLGIPYPTPLARFDELHFVDRRLVGSRPLDEPVPPSPPGQTFVRNRRLVNRMEFDKGGVSAADLRQLWTMATEPHSWLGPPTGLTLYSSRRRSNESGRDGCQLIATGESGRELWFQLPEPDDYDRLAPGRQRNHYEGSFTEYEAAQKWIFRTVGVDLDPPDDRPLRHKLIGRHRTPPEIIRWP